MKGTILITDSLFIFPEHEKLIKNAGYTIERLDTPMATEAQLIEKLKGKVGYILGGIEKVTDKVIDSGESLKVICFTGSDWRSFIPGHVKASAKGIAIANTPGANSYAVAEYALTLMLAMSRNVFELGRAGEKKFQTTKSLCEQTVGILGMGKIGTRMAHFLSPLGPKKLLYSSRERKVEVDNKTNAEFVHRDELFSNCDIITCHVSKEAGAGYIGRELLSKMKDGSLIINCGYHDAIDKDALYSELKSGRLRAAQDDGFDGRFNELSFGSWYCSNMSTAYNTQEANKKASDMATGSLIRLLASGDDPYRVN